MADEEKKQRKARKSALTREVNNARRHMAEGNRAEVEQRIPSMKAKFSEFEKAQEAYHDKLTEETDIDGSENYFEEVANNYIEALLTLNKWLSAGDEVKPSAESGKKSEELTEQSELSKADFTTWANLPKIEIPCFSGDPMKYHSFLAVFNEHVHKKRLDETVKLTRLIQYTSGDAREAIESCVLLGADGYDEARKILQQRFGDDFIISERVIRSMKSGRKVTTAKELQTFCDELTRAKAILTSMGKLYEVDTTSGVRDIAGRLESELISKWKEKAMKYKKQNKKYPGFDDLVKFVMNAAEEATDPVYGYSNEWGKCADRKSSTSLHATTTSDQRPPISTSSASSRVVSPPCLLCGGPHHRLFACEQFRKLRPIDRLDLVRKNKLCENCLMDNHMTTQCWKPSVCSVPGCGLKHSKFIHVDELSNNSMRCDVSSCASVCQAKAVVNFSDCANVMLPLVRVHVNDRQCTNALLDSGSNSSFCTERLVRNLQLQGKPIKYSLKTLSDEQDRKSMIVDLNLRSYECGSMIQLCDVYVVPDIPVDVPAVDLHAHPHLRDLPLHIRGQVDILIGQCHAEALLPLEIRRGGKGDPFAVRTLLGWSVSGSATSPNRHSQKVVSNFVSSPPIPVSSADSDIKKLMDEHRQVPIRWKPEEDCCFPVVYKDIAQQVIDDTKPILAEFNVNGQNISGPVSTNDIAKEASRVKEFEAQSKNEDFSLNLNDPEVRKKVCTTCITGNDVRPVDVHGEYHSSWFKMKQFIAWWIWLCLLLCLCGILVSKECPTSWETLSVTEMGGEKMFVSSQMQSWYYFEDISNSSSLTTLQSNIDEDGILLTREEMKSLNWFWICRTEQYLLELQRRLKWKEVMESSKIEDLVVFFDVNTPENLWPPEIVSSVQTWGDRKVCIVSVRTLTASLPRPVTKIVKLEGD